MLLFLNFVLLLLFLYHDLVFYVNYIMDIDILYDMYKSGIPFEELIQKGNTVPEGKKPVFGFEAVMNMKKKFK